MLKSNHCLHVIYRFFFVLQGLLVFLWVLFVEILARSLRVQEGSQSRCRELLMFKNLREVALVETLLADQEAVSELLQRLVQSEVHLLFRAQAFRCELLGRHRSAHVPQKAAQVAAEVACRPLQACENIGLLSSE